MTKWPFGLLFQRATVSPWVKLLVKPPIILPQGD